ncbi:MAG: internalization-related competence protein ComEC/Rec2 protein [Candidatus Woesebacteria bacterium GW2011_GWB1_39_12]|uniref:Internalization-related competence protein ComEC/Rec2 protein n=2 Tax=Candidatus Woeseibacteriota TaxID=1752722 RepID=A0A0G0M0F7_9BACT|nr:MAG: internalization-related competence protein ComEC/Rec2 protein [Candidatus Woesebacteria bacterium GW2011_GWA1_39_12]KKR01180.1 MAG: internalization-related competence protein ComEC/Rec2 protein [Candidatus Woesebacteria bacterium GW2011_GWB1_39_12]
MSIRFKYLFFFLLLITALVWITVITYSNQNLKLIACDVGQGDAILAIYGKTQILIDGGPNNRVLDCLSRYMPFWDRNVEMVVLTHPQTDHYMGLIEVFNKYEVEVFLANALDSSSQSYQVLKERVGSKGVKVVNPRSGMKVRVGLIHLDILHPSMQYILSETVRAGESKDSFNGVLGAFTSSRDPNEFSVVVILSYKNFDALMTGDIGPKEIDQIISTGKMRDIDYLKVPHHGSKNGLTEELLEVSKSEVAVISSGKNNSYGHPHEETLKILKDKDIRILRTDEIGDIIIETDGQKTLMRK